MPIDITVKTVTPEEMAEPIEQAPNAYPVLRSAPRAFSMETIVRDYLTYGGLAGGRYNVIRDLEQTHMSMLPGDLVQMNYYEEDQDDDDGKGARIGYEVLEIASIGISDLDTILAVHGPANHVKEVRHSEVDPYDFFDVSADSGAFVVIYFK